MSRVCATMAGTCTHVNLRPVKTLESKGDSESHCLGGVKDLGHK